MKVITEERLIEFKNSTRWCQRTLQELLEECQELDTLTVTRLRPMSEAPKDGQQILVYYSEWEMFLMMFWDEQNSCWTTGLDDQEFKESEMEGFIPMPIYEPEKV